MEGPTLSPAIVRGPVWHAPVPIPRCCPGRCHTTPRHRPAGSIPRCARSQVQISRHNQAIWPDRSPSFRQCSAVAGPDQCNRCERQNLAMYRSFPAYLPCRDDRRLRISIPTNFVPIRMTSRRRAASSNYGANGPRATNDRACSCLAEATAAPTFSFQARHARGAEL